MKQMTEAAVERAMKLHEPPTPARRRVPVETPMPVFDKFNRTGPNLILLRKKNPHDEFALDGRLSNRDTESMRS